MDLQFEEGVDIASEEASVEILSIELGPLAVVPDFKDLLELVAEFQGFVQLEGRPDPSEASLLVCMVIDLKSKSVVCEADE